MRKVARTESDLNALLDMATEAMSSGEPLLEAMLAQAAAKLTYKQTSRGIVRGQGDRKASLTRTAISRYLSERDGAVNSGKPRL
jgi:hypothetical protein